MSYNDYLKSEDWKKKRKKKYSKPRRCAICADTKDLNVHHLNYGNLYDVEQTDLRVLCRRCHKLAHELIQAGRIKFKNKNHHSRFGILKGVVKGELGIAGKNMFKSNMYTELIEKKRIADIKQRKISEFDKERID